MYFVKMVWISLSLPCKEVKSVRLVSEKASPLNASGLANFRSPAGAKVLFITVEFRIYISSVTYGSYPAL